MDFSLKPKFDQIIKTILEKPATPPATPAHQNIEDMHVGR